MVETKYIGIKEIKELYSGIFWVLSDNEDLSDYEFIYFNIPCDNNGVVTRDLEIKLNSKNGLTYNHKAIWTEQVQNNSVYKPYNKKSYDYYPRGRVEISNNKATIYLNPHINQPDFIKKIKQKFGLMPDNISEVKISADGSNHYRCFLD
jgi:hypothetical protein